MLMAKIRYCQKEMENRENVYVEQQQQNNAECTTNVGGDYRSQVPTQTQQSKTRSID